MAGSSDNFHGAFNLGRTSNLDSADYILAKGNGCGEVSSYQGAPRKIAPGYASPEALRQSNRAYHANVMYNDVQIGIILDALQSSGSKDDTIIVFTGDHGFHLGDKGLYCKHTNFEAATKTPVVIVPAIRDPIKYQRGGKSYAPVELLDIMPTLFEMARLQSHVDLSSFRTWQGVSLVPILKDPENAYVKQMAVSQYFRNTGSALIWGYSVRTTRYRYTGWGKFFEELYDYLQDEWETNSLQKNQALRNSLLNQAYYGGRNFNAGKMKIPFDFADRAAMRDRPSSSFA
jgi:iduronate 2-sulfatase